MLYQCRQSFFFFVKFGQIDMEFWTRKRAELRTEERALQTAREEWSALEDDFRTLTWEAA